MDKQDLLSFNYKLTIVYDGTNYSGWQVQPNGVSIQEKIENSLQVILRKKVSVIGSGRTDAGVHAVGQIAHFKCTMEIDAFRFLNSLNGLLPPDIRIKSLESVPLTFHAQHSVSSKIYHYHLYLHRIDDPFRRPYYHKVHEKIDLNLLRQAAQMFLGTHDFTAFTNSAKEGTAAYDPIRTIYRLDVIEVENGLRLEFEGNGFLYKMVRNIVGTLLEVATEKRPLTDIPLIFEGRDRRRAGMAAPCQGLFLYQVNY